MPISLTHEAISSKSTFRGGLKVVQHLSLHIAKSRICLGGILTFKAWELDAAREGSLPKQLCRVVHPIPGQKGAKKHHSSSVNPPWS